MNTRTLAILAFFVGVASSFFGGTLGILAASPFTAERTEAVFVYGTLTNPIARAYACVCLTSLNEQVLGGYTKTVRDIVPTPSGMVRGGIIKVSETELARLDQYEDVPERYLRERITFKNQPVWVYRKSR